MQYRDAPRTMALTAAVPREILGIFGARPLRENGLTWRWPGRYDPRTDQATDRPDFILISGDLAAIRDLARACGYATQRPGDVAERTYRVLTAKLTRHQAA